MAAAAVTFAREHRRLAFTAYGLKRLPAPHEGQVDYWDNSTPGFGVRISAKGTRAWVGMTRLLGQSAVKRFTLGRYAERDDDGGLTLAQARSEWLSLKKRIKSGEDPRRTEAEEKAHAIQRQAHTFESVVKEFLATHHPEGKPALRPSTLRRYKLVLMGPDLAEWGRRPIASITRADVLAALHRMKARGLGVSCNRGLAAIKVLMNWAIQWGLIDADTAPTDRIKRIAAEVVRDRHLFGDVEHDRPSEIALLWKATDRVGPFGALPKLLLLTGQRRDEVTGMRQSELIDLDGKHPRWSLPPERTKNNKRHLVPLSPEAVRIIRDMPRIAGSEFVFSTTGSTAFSGFSNLKEKIERTIAAIKKEHPTQYGRQFTEEWRLHDLRRTMKTGLSAIRISSEIRDELLGHAKQGMDRVYDHAQHADEKREAMAKWEHHILDLVKADRPTTRRRK